jgi:hypothetical protein
MSKPKLVRAISTKLVYGQVDIRKLLALTPEGENIGRTMPMYRVVGRANALKTGETDKGEFVAFIGEFKAIVGDQEYRSAKFFAPSVSLTEMIQGALGNSSGFVDFAFDIGAHYDATAIAKYVYDVTPLLAPKASDALEMISAQIEAPKALPGPVDTDTGEVKTPAKGKKKR